MSFELTSLQELGHVGLVPRESVDQKLVEYFRKLFQAGSASSSAERLVSVFKSAVLDGKAVVAVHPRGAIETRGALQFSNELGPVELFGVDLDNQKHEHAATERETPIFTWRGKVLAAPGAPDTTGTAELP